MSVAAPRSASQRKADTLALLRTAVLDGWVASAGLVEGAVRAHLVPLSLAWIDEHVVISLDADSITARNIVAHRSARLGIGETRDVVMIDATVDEVVPVAGAPRELGDRFAAQADWDPRTAGGYIYIVLRPQRIQAWRNVDEDAGRTIMRDGTWVD